MGKSTINLQFSIVFLYVYQAGYPPVLRLPRHQVDGGLDGPPLFLHGSWLNSMGFRRYLEGQGTHPVGFLWYIYPPKNEPNDPKCM